MKRILQERDLEASTVKTRDECAVPGVIGESEGCAAPIPLIAGRVLRIYY